MSHTPGPWAWRCIDVCGLPRNYKYLAKGMQAVLPDDQVLGVTDGYSITVSEDNARLIAAAPDMLEALRTTAANIRSLGPAGALDAVPMPYQQWLAVVETAIAKAEGGGP